MSRPILDPLDAGIAAEPPHRVDRANWLHACFAPVDSFLDTATTEEVDEPGWRPIAFWWPTSAGVQLVLMPSRSLVQ